jgi:integrase
LPPIHVLSLPSEDAAFCPVMAMKAYMAFRGDLVGVSPLWSHPTRSVLITSRHLASWLRSTIVGTYRRTNQPQPSKFTPHSVRAAAASYAWKGNLPLPTILEQCRWAKESTFTAHYLRRLAKSDGTVFWLKPLAIASLL